MKKLIKFITLCITCLLVVGTLYAAKMAVSEKTDVDDIFSRADISIFSNIRERTQTAAEHADKKSKEADIKKNKLTNELRKIYLDKKNFNTNPNKKSRALYAEAVNELYNAHH